MIAVIDTDGTRLVVWGLGETREAALADAAKWDYEESDEQRYVEVTDEQTVAIRAGEIDWFNLASIAARAAGRAWADREADAVLDWSNVSDAWLSPSLDALPLIDEDEGQPTRRALADIANAAASKRWSEIVAERTAAE